VRRARDRALVELTGGLDGCRRVRETARGPTGTWAKTAVFAPRIGRLPPISEREHRAAAQGPVELRQGG